MQVKSLSSLGWFLSIGTFGQLFAALVVVYKLVMNPWVGATTEMVHNGEGPALTLSACTAILTNKCSRYKSA